MFASHSEVQSKIVCGGLCVARPSSDCGAFVYQSDTRMCYLGKVGVNSTHLSTVTYEESVYINVTGQGQGGFDSSLLLLVDVVVADWTERVYWTDTEVAPLTHEDCGTFCTVAEFGSCEFYIHDDSLCHVGSVTGSGGSATSVHAIRDVYVMSGKSFY